MIIKTYFKEIIFLLDVLFIGICAIILTCSYTFDVEEQKCVEFYKENNYITKSCEIYKDKLENINE